ncbi:GNAT family N-acetyltransferase [Solicola gregarius]|uniref:GNAT family N-acetyltransferase n=1 Tax=Solicola gregarius TaxID=2908642 RepID=A0AA46YMD3_9ACTN|nr:GNAT family protein [Solicola gregarius]UYM06416.1 GNAT family N-acetyltransferase [Solicola gregarius]
MAASFATKPTLQGDLVTLRPFEPSDLPTMAAAIADPEVGRLTGSYNSSAELGSGGSVIDDELRGWYLSRGEQVDRLDLAVVDRAAGGCVGEVVLNQYDEGSSSCNFRTLLGQGGRGRGLGTEAARLIVGYGFDDLGLHRISLEVYDFNPRARRAYEKVGFVAEGRLRDALRFDGEWIDATVMSMLSTDPRP